jgi:PAS domain S-box-containing protein
MLWMTDIEGRCLYLNKPLRDFWGIDEGDCQAFDWGATVHPDDAETLYGPYAEAMKARQPYTVEARYRRGDGVYRRFVTHAEPRFDAAGEFIGMIGVNIDVTETRDVEERYRRIFEQASDLILTADLKQIITDCNPAAAKSVGLTREQAIGRSISDFISPDDFAVSSSMLDAKLRNGGTTQYDVRVRSSNGDWLYWEINSGLTFDDGGNAVGLHVVARDVTERKRFERHQQLLVGELNHRVKNTLAIVQSLAHQSFHADIAPADAISRFNGRLQALSGAHNLLTRENWEAASIQEIVSSGLAPFCTNDRCTFSGPDVRLQPQTAVSLALALHELATNASKYGALSNDSGKVFVTWSAGEQLEFNWREEGGPPVHAPDSRGFGTRMIERTLSAEFGGKVELQFAPGGVTCRVIAPIPPSTT